MWAKAQPRVAFVSPDPKDTKNEFWTITTYQVQKAAKDLGVDLEVLYSNSHPSYYFKEIEKVVNRPKELRPEYIMILPIKSNIYDTLKLLATTDIKVMLVNIELTKKDQKEVGSPRDKFKNWIGSFFPDEEQAATLVAKEVGKYCKEGSDIVSINGTHLSNASLIREQVFAKVAKELGQNLRQSLYGNWKKDRVRKMLPYIEGRYPNICGFLVASDFMAEAIQESRKGGYQVCSIDWTSSGIKNVMDKKQLCSVGGHYLELAFALVALFDYHKGIDFKNDFGLTYKTPFHLATIKNAKKIYQKFILNKDSLNYKNYSKFYTKKKKYNFNILQGI